ncbi:MAG TPA: restriction endonuclease subunit S [Prolixibacteraceae bacterium]|nr:restriction endonuclease subunit S [Prolixibacteraceae bacterium]
MIKTRNKVPKLRFPEFDKEWKESKIDKIFDRVVNSVEVEKDKEYQQIGIRSHGKGIFHKDFVLGSDLGNKRVFWLEENLFIVNIVFAWEMAVAKTSMEEVGLIASHRFPMYKPKNDILDLDFIHYFFLRKKGKYILELASPGGAGRNKTLGQNEFAKSKVVIPQSISEQQKIASILTAVDAKIEQLAKKKSLLEQYKKGVMQQIFSKQLRFKDENGNNYTEWVTKKLGDIVDCLDCFRKPLNGGERNKIQGIYPYWGANNIMGYINDFIFDETVVLLAEDGGNFNEFSTKPIANISYGRCWVNNHTHVLRGKKDLMLNEFLFYSLVHKDITGFVSGGTRSKLIKSEMLKIKLKKPSIEEQTQIANFLSSIDAKIELVNTQIGNTQKFKKGLLQQLFV